MSKISEQKALEAYPIKHVVLPFCFSVPDLNEPYRKPYQEGYNQAMQDFLEKACEYLAGIALTHPHLIDLDDFKNYMQDEM
jgi:hypothetical protein